MDLAEYCRPVAFVVEYSRHFMDYDEGNCEAVLALSAAEAREWGEDRGDVVDVKREPLFDKGESALVWLEAGYSFECEACEHRITKFGEGIYCDTTETSGGVVVGKKAYCSQQCADGCPEEHQEEEDDE